MPSLVNVRLTATGLNVTYSEKPVIVQHCIAICTTGGVVGDHIVCGPKVTLTMVFIANRLALNLDNFGANTGGHQPFDIGTD
jgi:hypothetical protein